MKLRIPPSPVGRVEERERAVEDRRPDLLVAAAGKRERHDREAGDVVDAVAAVAVGDDPVRVLHDPDVVDEREQMVGAQARRDAGRATPDGRRRGASSRASRSTDAVASATDGHASDEPIRRASARAAASVSGCST